MPNLRTYLLDITREGLLSHLEKNKTFTEIGVAVGAFSQEILERCAPSTLTLIDSWYYQEDPNYPPDMSNVENTEHEKRYQLVREKFAADNIRILRKTSFDAADDFETESLDFIYIDAMHTYEAVLNDLKRWWPKLKPDGLLMGHDYANHITAKKMGFGVVAAVNQFVTENGCAFVGITNELYPSYILAKSWDGCPKRLIEDIRVLCSFDAGKAEWEIVLLSDGNYKAFFKF